MVDTTKEGAKRAPLPNEAGAVQPDVAEFSANMAKMMERGQQLWAKSVETTGAEQSPATMDPFNIAPAFTEFWRSMWSDPTRMADATLKFWTDQAELWRRASLKASGQDVAPLVAPERGDKRFADPEWTNNAVFDALKQSYLLTARYLTDAAQGAGELDERDRRKVAFYTRQFVEAISPNNYFATNPAVLRATFEESGANLVRGMDFMLEDLARGDNKYLMIRHTDLNKFKVGENMALTPGEVIYQNDVMELIQYAPSTPKVQKRPVVICPPWINKFYILDLNPEKSLIRWLVEQGHTVFVVSWANPDKTLAEKTFADYISEGLFDAVTRACDECDVEDAHVASYCIGGTMVATALAYLAQQPEHPVKSKIASATFFTSQTEFSDAGELQLFVDDEQMKLLRDISSDGVLDAEKMAMSFNMLRASDLIWGFVVNNYLLGKEPFPFDLLFWNSDSTRIPLKMHMYYLERFYRDNALAMGDLILGGGDAGSQQDRHPDLSCRHDRGSHRAAGVGLSRIAPDGRRAAFRARRIGPHRGHREPAVEEEVSALGARRRRFPGDA